MAAKYTKMSQSTSLNSSGASVVSKKRKSSPLPKFYAVRFGHTPGVYRSWKECEQNTTGFPGASFKSFLTLGEAEAFVAGRAPAVFSTPSSGIEKFYGVAKGRIPGVYTEWAAAQEQIKGWKGPKYKKFATRSEAESFVQSGSGAPVIILTGRMNDADDRTLDGCFSDDDTGSAHVFKKAKTIPLARKTSTKIADQQGTQQERDDIKVVNAPRAMGGNEAGVLRVHTDGSSLGNGKSGARAGLGVYFGAEDPRNVAERLPGDLQTNQRAELAAILRALEISPTNQDVHIITDSQYSINCVTVWYKSWERNQWQTSAKKPVLNKDLIKGVLAKLKDREILGTSTRFSWVKGHSKDPGNEAADRLAVLGAQKQRTD